MFSIDYQSKAVEMGIQGEIIAGFTISKSKKIINSRIIKGLCMDLDKEVLQTIKEMPVWKSVLYIAGGLAGLIFGGQLFVDGASGLARSWGVSESVIGLTLVAGGTSLPELATSVTAALKKNPGIAIGNVIGSNLFNIFFVLGCSATVSPLPMGNINNLDLSVLIASSLLLWLVGWFFRKRTITRLEGALMVGCYVVYTAYLIAQQ